MNPEPLRPAEQRGFRRVRALLRRGFTLIELIVVMAIVALLVSIAVPRYFTHLDRSKEAVLKSDLAVLRDALDKYHGDTGRWPESLDELVKKRYIRALPVDPMTERADSWITVQDPIKGGISDVRSGAEGKDANGVAYADW